MPEVPTQVWSWESTATLAPAAPSRNGPLEFSRALVLLTGSHPGYISWPVKREGPVEVVDRGMNINPQWSETDLVDDPEQRRKEGWIVFEGSDTWADCNTPLHMAMLADSMDIVALLLSRGADINIYNARGQTMLYKAICRGSAKWVEFLLRHGIFPDMPTVPRSVSCWFSNTHCDEWPQPGGYLPLFRAIWNQSVTIINLLLEHGADVNQSVLGWQPLDLAVLGRDREIVGILLSNGAQFSASKSCVTDSGSSTNVYSKQNAIHRLPEAEKIAKSLIASSDSLPGPEARQVFDKVITSGPIGQLQRDTTMSMEQKISDLLSTFFDILSRVAHTPNPDHPPLPHCGRCVELQLGPAFRGHGPIWTWGRMKELMQSVSGGCPVCNLLLDAINYPQFGEEKPINDEDGVELTAYEERWEMSCGSRRSSIQLRPIFDDLMMHNKGEVVVDTNPGQSTCASGAFELARRWLDHCESTHTNTRRVDSRQGFYCPKSPKNPPRLPTRVISVGEEAGLPHLLEANGLRAPYCALSYCWGNTKSLVSTRASLSSHLKRIPVESLPKTPREAVFAARQLGFQYIWIDALCIVQDDDEDWEREAATMQDVYYNARLVLCASDSDDCDGGLFRPRKEGLISPVQLMVPIPSKTCPGKTCMYALPARASRARKESSPVDSRAWTLQERILSLRILYFGEGILRWECLTMQASETDPDGILEASRARYDGITCRDRRLLQGRPLWEHNLAYYSLRTAVDDAEQRALEASLPYEAWEKTVAEFSRRNVTIATDRVPGILGLARRMEAVIGDEFVAGIWKGKFGLRSLCWDAVRAGRPINHYPSFSWASTTSPVQYSLLHTDNVRHGLVTWHVSAPEFDVEARGSQRTVQGSIKIRGMMRPAIESLVRKEVPWGYDTSIGIQSLNDTLFDHEDETSAGCEYLVMASIKGPRNLAPRVVCMMVRPVDDSRKKWRRVGMCSLEDNKDFWLDVEQNRAISII